MRIDKDFICYGCRHLYQQATTKEYFCFDEDEGMLSINELLLDRDCEDYEE